MRDDHPASHFYAKPAINQGLPRPTAGTDQPQAHNVRFEELVQAYILGNASTRGVLNLSAEEISERPMVGAFLLHKLTVATRDDEQQELKRQRRLIARETYL